MRFVPSALVALFLLSGVAIPNLHRAISATTPPQGITIAPPTGLPVRLIIPSIGLNSPILGMGVNNKGELDVPNGKTQNVGWYSAGAIPGTSGNAVMDAHVFAAFKNLKYLTPGSSIYVVTTTGELLHFVTDVAATYKLKDLSSDKLFGATPNKGLNLITCAGDLTPDHSTYDHRLVVFSRLVDKTSYLE
jgi:sortase A